LAELRLLHLLACRSPRRRSAEAATGVEEEGFMAAAVEEDSTGAAVGFMAVAEAVGTSLAGVEDALMAAGAFTAAGREWRREWAETRTAGWAEVRTAGAEARTAGWADMGVVRRRRPPEIG